MHFVKQTDEQEFVEAIVIFEELKHVANITHRSLFDVLRYVFLYLRALTGELLDVTLPITECFQQISHVGRTRHRQHLQSVLKELVEESFAKQVTFTPGLHQTANVGHRHHVAAESDEVFKRLDDAWVFKAIFHNDIHDQVDESDSIFQFRHFQDLLEGINGTNEQLIAVFFLTPVHKLDGLFLPLVDRQITFPSLDLIKLLDVAAENLECGTQSLITRQCDVAIDEGERETPCCSYIDLHLA